MDSSQLKLSKVSLNLFMIIYNPNYNKKKHDFHQFNEV